MLSDRLLKHQNGIGMSKKDSKIWQAPRCYIHGIGFFSGRTSGSWSKSTTKKDTKPNAFSQDQRGVGRSILEPLHEEPILFGHFLHH